jgi:outer membrane receptor protein involved in Fe transport
MGFNRNRTFCLALVAGLASVAQAQESTEGTPEALETIPVAPTGQEEATPESTAAETGTDGFEEIVVTATKRSQSVREIPMTINVLTGDKLAEQGARELQDFVDQVPGLQMQDVAVTSSRKIVIRGIAPDNTTNQTVGTVLGDIPLGDPIGSFTVVDPDTWDLGTVEVLKGPQGTLFGASSLAGIIRYVPNAPKLETWQGKAFAEYMSIEDGDAAPTFGGALNMPVGSTLAVRMSGVIEHRPGVIDIDNPARQKKDADDSRKKSGRLMVLWEPTDRLTVNAWYMAQVRKADESFYVTSFDGEYTRYDAPSASPTKRSFDLVTLDARYRFDWATLVSLSAYQDKQNHFDFDGSYALLEQAAAAGTEVGRTKRDVNAHGVMQEFRLVSPDDGPWTWQSGIFFSDFRADIKSDIFFTDPAFAAPLLALVPTELLPAVYSENGLSLGSQSLAPLKARESAWFGEVTRALGPVNLTLGGRLYETKVKGVSTTAGLAPLLTNLSAQTVQDLGVKSHGFSPKFALTWNATDDILVYGGVSRGFQFGGVNAVAIPAPNSSAPETYKSSKLWSYEAGVRSDWFDRTLRADLTAFYQLWDNAQVSQIAPPAEAYIANVGKVKVKGVEASLQYRLPIEGLSLDTNGSYLQSETAAVFTDSNGNEIPKGSDMPNAPHFQGSATIAYQHIFGGVWGTNTSLQLTHANEAWGNVERTGKLQARDLLNFNISVARSDLSFAPSLSLIVNNITDERKVVSATESDAPPAPTDIDRTAVGYTRPRTFILRLSADFQ